MGTDLPSVGGADASLPVQPTDDIEQGSMSILPVGDVSTAVELSGEATGSLNLEAPAATGDVAVAEEVAAPAEATY